MGGVGLPLPVAPGRGSLLEGAITHLAALAAACGPWLLTVLAVTGVALTHRGPGEGDATTLFTIVIIYNFAFSLVVASPVVVVVSRRIADQIYVGDITEACGLLLGALALVLAAQAIVAIPYYGFIVDLEPELALIALASFFIVGAIWVCAAFLTARRNFISITAIFAIGMTIAVALASAPTGGATQMLGGFTVGLAAILVLLIGKILAAYPVPVEAPAAVLSALREHRVAALAAFFYVLGIWIDKWIMWFAPGHQVIAGAMRAHPAYDAATFLAFLSVIPAITLFFMSMETRLRTRYRAYFRDVGAHATLSELRADHDAILHDLGHLARRIVIVQTAISYVLILLAPQLIAAAGGGIEMVPIFRLAALGALFHAMIIFITLVLGYLDFRSLVLKTSFAFLVMNGAFSALSLALGPSFQGYGYALASILCLIYAHAILRGALLRFPYMTFVAQNKGLH